MPTPPHHIQTKARRFQRQNGFTLLELLVAMVILIISLSIAFQAFNGTIRAWKRGTQVMENIKHGEYSMTQLLNALYSTVYFEDTKKSYGFIFEKNDGAGSEYPSDTISWITASSAFMPHDSPFKRGLHRLRLFIDTTEDGEPGLFAEALPVIARLDEFEAEPILITTGIQGIECEFYDEEQDDWTDQWEQENSIPERIKIALFAPPRNDEEEEPVIFTRIVEIPVMKSVGSGLKGPTITGQKGQQKR